MRDCVRPKTHQFDGLMGCQWAYSNDFLGPSPELPQLQLFLFPHRLHLVLVPTLCKM